MAGKRRNLPPAARAAARLEVGGAGPREIARQLGVGERTVRDWRRRDDYRAVRDRLARETDASVIELATEVRRKALEAVDEIIQHARDRLKNMKDVDAAVMLKAVTDAYKTTAAQTGITETKRHEVEVSTVTPEEEEEAAARVVGGLRR